MALIIAGRTIVNPMATLEKYAKRYSRTLAEYDFGKSGDPDVLTIGEVRGTRVIASRISEAQARELVVIAAEHSDLWAAVPAGARLRDADPGESGGLYDAMESLFDSLRFFGVNLAKASKVLHRKRPHAYPILDRHLLGLYRDSARESALLYPERRFKKMFWAAVRQDVIANADGLSDLRQELAKRDGAAQQLHQLSDVRLLDILAWKLANSETALIAGDEDGVHALA